MALLLARPSARRGIKRRPFLAEINVTPFVDVMLVLLIVFMVTAPLLTVGIPVDLPKTEARALPDPATEPLVITIQGDGAVFYKKRRCRSPIWCPSSRPSPPLAMTNGFTSAPTARRCGMW
jgi:Cell division and transport-associated protein TolR (TC 2.C.1.2.1)